MTITDTATPAIPHELTRAVSDFKSAMLTADKLLITGDVAEADVQHQIDTACTTMTAHLRAHVQSGADPDDIGAFVHREAYPYFALSTLIDRSYTKPRGYAGDYLTLQMVYDDRADGVRRLGPYIDRWFLDIPASRAVKNRRQLLRGIISDTARAHPQRRVAVTSLACGPAREIFDIFGEPDHPDIGATCVDIDDEALGYARSIAHGTGTQSRVRFVRSNVVKLALGRETLDLRDQDLVYSIGLIDYLRDALVVKLLDWIHDTLRPGGVAVVGNFDVGNPDKAFMDHVLDWRLIHRSPQNLADLFAQSAFGHAPVDVRTEETGINLFAMARRMG